MTTPDATPGVAIPVATTPGVARSPYWEPWHDWTIDQYAGVRFGSVYRCYDVTGRLIYVGSTGDIWNRISAHRVQTAFYDRFARITYREKLMADARALEVATIQAERPPLNKQHNPTYDAASSAERKALFAAALAEIPVSPAEPVVENEIPVSYFAERMRAAA